jgi:membrane-associated phospholipid phosphatase
MRGRTRVLLVAAALAACASPRAAPASPEAGGPAVAADAASLASALAPPPAPGSDGAKADLAVVLWLQRTRDADDVARARREIGLGLDAFAPALGPGFASGAHPRTAALLDRAHAFATPAIRGAKARFGRVRPYDADRRVAPAVEKEDTPSYPSSHATRAVLVARVLAELAPARREALVELGRRVGYDRVVAGVHYPSDVLGGQQLGAALADALLADASFAAELERARGEWR